MARPKASATPSKPSKSHKRHLSAAPSSTPATVTPGSRASKRLKESTGNTPSTAKKSKSKYFEGSDDDEEEEPTTEDASESGYEDNEDASAATEDASVTSAASSSEDDVAASESEEDVKRKKKTKSKPAAAKGAKNTFGRAAAAESINSEGKELWRQGVKTGLGPGKQVFIEKPKPRGDGGIKYVPDKIHPNTMEFLRDLKKNNDREWLKLHDPDYRTSWRDWESFVQSLTEKISEIDETIPELPPKDLVFRIYRDVRFSNDQTPYKPYFSAFWSRTGRKGPFAGYYVQLQPGGKTRVGAGLWMPEPQPLAAIRRDIDRRPERIRRVLTDAALRKKLLGGIGNDEKKVIKAFAQHNTENALKTKPKGYEADNPNIELLRLRNFTMGASLPDSELVGAKGISSIMDLVGTMSPFVTYLNSVVMPDDDEDNDEDDDAPQNESGTPNSEAGTE